MMQQAALGGEDEARRDPHGSAWIAPLDFVVVDVLVQRRGHPRRRGTLAGE